jgi:RNA polymerase sigma-70 factor (ECF subfamily)
MRKEVDSLMAADADASPDRHEPPAAGAEAAGSAKSKLFLRLFLQNERRLYAYILTLLPNRADADDVLQEASLVLWDKFDERHPPDDFAAWGCRVAYFKVLDFYKKSRRSRVRFSQAVLERVAETAVEQAATLQLDERREALAACIDRLRPQDRDLLARRFADGATTQSTAAQVGRSVEAVYKALAGIRKALFDCVTRTLDQGRHP